MIYPMNLRLSTREMNQWRAEERKRWAIEQAVKYGDRWESVDDDDVLDVAAKFERWVMEPQDA